MHNILPCKKPSTTLTRKNIRKFYILLFIKTVMIRLYIYICTECKKIHGIYSVKFSLGFLWCFLYILRNVASNELRTYAVFLPSFEHKNCLYLQMPLASKVVGNAGIAFFMKCGLSVSWSTSLNCDTVSNINVNFPTFPCPTFN